MLVPLKPGCAVICDVSQIFWIPPDSNAKNRGLSKRTLELGGGGQPSIDFQLQLYNLLHDTTTLPPTHNPTDRRFKRIDRFFVNMSNHDRDLENQKFSQESLRRDEESELQNFASIESYGAARSERSGGDSFLQLYSVYGHGNQEIENSGTPHEVVEQAPKVQPVSAGGPTGRFKKAVQTAMLERKALSAFTVRKHLNDSKHTRKPSSVRDLLESIKEDSIRSHDEYDHEPEGKGHRRHGTKADNPFDVTIDTSIAASQTNRLIAGALQVESLFEEDGEEDDSSIASSSIIANDQISGVGQEESPLIQRANGPASSLTNAQRKVRRSSKLLCRHLKSITAFLLRLLVTIPNGLLSAYCTMIALPLFLTAWILYYYIGNPTLDFLPGSATISWWLNFFGRQLLTFELARVVQFMVIDVFTLQTKLVINLGGPLLTLVAIQSKGWPFLVCAWACLDLCILHGDNKFPVHWLYWTGIRIYSQANSGSYILNSESYLRFLLCLVLAGVATSAKRTYVAIRFGRKMFGEFKPRLEKILQDICLLAEVADLAHAVEELADDVIDEETVLTADSARSKRSNPSEKSLRETLTFKNHLAKEVERMGDKVRFQGVAEEEAETIVAGSTTDQKSPFSVPLSRSDSGSIRLKQLLDRWEEPVDKNQKLEASIKDVLRFRRAVELMDDSKPFGEVFGRASSRDDCISSANSLYWKLLTLTPDESLLPYDTLTIVVQDEASPEEREGKKFALRRLFRPDRFGQIAHLSFVQTCDSLYRRLRYFRASVLNASAIDRVLEDIIDTVFGFILFLVVLSVMNVNPWPLLVSFSTLLVSFSFAMGKSVSTWIEGLLFIAVQRPYGLGDRIVIAASALSASPDVSQSWFVEDINLYFTTLRFAATNEISTVRNGDLCSNRIVNCNRSFGAIVGFEIQFHISLLDGDTLQAFSSSLQAFIDDRPQDWDAIVFSRIQHIDVDNEFVVLKFGLRHRFSWQSAGRVLVDRGELLRFVYREGERLRVSHSSGPSRVLQYSAGYLRHGSVSGYMRGLTSKENIIDYHIKVE